MIRKKIRVQWCYNDKHRFWSWSFACPYSPLCRWISQCCRIQCLYYFSVKVNTFTVTSMVWKVLPHSAIGQAASISPMGENEILSRPARFISRNRLIEEMIWLLNLQLNLLKKSRWSECDSCGKLCISVAMCMHSAFEIAKRQRHLPDGHQRPAKPDGSAQAPRSPFSVLSPSIIYTKREIMRVTSNAIWFESNCAKTSKNIKTESA